MENWPIYYKELLEYGNPDSPVGIVTLWTMCDKVLSDIDNKYYSVAGQLYTKGGINYIVRNCLANKKIRYLIVCGQDRSGSGQEIVNFWQTEKCEILHKEIAAPSIKSMLENVQLINMIGEEDGKKIEEAVKKLDLTLGSYGQREEFDEPQPGNVSELECSFPAEPSVFRVQEKTVAEAWLQIIKHVLKFGDVKETDAMKMKEVLNMTAVVTDEDPDNFFIPEYLGCDKSKVQEYLPQVTTGEKNSGLHYTYGHRLQSHFKVNQVDKIVEKLIKDNNAREAVGVFFDPNSDHDAEHRPCLTLIQLLRNKGKVNLNVYVRSHDLFGGWPLNAFGLRKLQQMICQRANLPMGVMTIISGSAHIYDFNWDQAQKIVAEHYRRKFVEDPRGYFKIDIDKAAKKIVAQHYGQEGQLLQTFEQEVERAEKAAYVLGNKIYAALGISLIAHALDLGMELQKAEIALRMGINYIQDRPLELSARVTPTRPKRTNATDNASQERLF